MKATAPKACAVALVCLMSASLSAPAARAEVSLAGTWALVAADVLHADGTRAHDYGAAPKGLLLIDAQGHYSLQIFKAERPHFASGDKLTGTSAEYQAAVLGSSTHFGMVSVEPAAGTLTFKIEQALDNPNGVSPLLRHMLRRALVAAGAPAADAPAATDRR